MATRYYHCSIHWYRFNDEGKSELISTQDIILEDSRSDNKLFPVWLLFENLMEKYCIFEGIACIPSLINTIETSKRQVDAWRASYDWERSCNRVIQVS